VGIGVVMTGRPEWEQAAVMPDLSY